MNKLSYTFSLAPLILYIAIVGVALTGCAVFHDPSKPVPISSTALGRGEQSATLLPGGDYHLMTVRPQPGSKPGDGVLCSEPSPDWATAFGNAFGVAASGGVAAGPSASLNANGSSTETITAMLGRTAGVVALRDGLYSACQAYANGIIGRNAYGLILSQYGNLLVAVATGGAGDAPAPANAVINLASTTTPSGGGPGAAKDAASGKSPSSPRASSGTDSGTVALVPIPVSNRAALLQQQAVQALLASCITDQDPSTGHATPRTGPQYPPRTVTNTTWSPLPNRNPLLTAYCGRFMDAVITKIPELLTPPLTAWKQTAAATARPNKAASGSAAVRKLQAILAADGDYSGKPDGIYGPATAAAYAAYQKKHATRHSPA